MQAEQTSTFSLRLLPLNLSAERRGVSPEASLALTILLYYTMRRLPLNISPEASLKH